MAMTAENIRIAKTVLSGTDSLAETARKCGKTRGRIWQITRLFCMKYMFDNEKLDESGKLKPLNKLRYAWRNWNNGHGVME
jgi:hypothetical protein